MSMYDVDDSIRVKNAAKEYIYVFRFIVARKA
jgi:hypothetical protein